LRDLIEGGETLSVEFKGDWSGNRQTGDNPGLSDKDLTEALVAMANTNSGVFSPVRGVFARREVNRGWSAAEPPARCPPTSARTPQV